jgi:hypothetical protein
MPMKKLFSILIGILITISSFAAMPGKVYAPYVDVMLWPTFNIMSTYNATGQKYYTLAFIIAGTDNQPAWGGALNMSSNHMLDQVNQLRAVGGDVIVSFGGANGTPIDASITNVTSLVAAYQTVINKYGLTWIDFDIEGWWVQDQASIDRRNQAAKILQTNNPGLRITYCLPVMPFGLTADGVNIINKAKAAGVNIYGVNVMAMDYGQSNTQMGQAAISAAQNTRSQTGLNIGITPMIGKNDTQNETFTLANATEVLNFAKANAYVNMIAMWSVNRDNGGCPGQTSASPTCSGLSQSTFAFVNIFKSFSGGGCTPTAIVPYISVNGGTWQNSFSASVAAGGSVTIGPQPTDGTWKWTGPNGFTSTSRQITISNIQTSQGGGYVASYTNPSGCTSSSTFTITVTGGCTSTAIVPYISVNGGTAQNTSSASLAVGGSVKMSPQPTTGGSWSWTGPAGFTSTSREITISNIQTTQGGNYVTTYTNSGGCKSTLTFNITVTTGGGSCSTLPQYVENGGYVAGSKVKNVSNQYQCRPWPNSGWCNGAAWAYAPGTGTYWTDAWTLVGACTARMATEEINSSEIILETEGMIVSPNPVRGATATLFFDKKAGDVDVHFIQINGLEVSQERYLQVEKKLEVNVPRVQPGLYIIKVRGKNNTWAKKLVIE